MVQKASKILRPLSQLIKTLKKPDDSGEELLPSRTELLLILGRRTLKASCNIGDFILGIGCGVYYSTVIRGHCAIAILRAILRIGCRVGVYLGIGIRG